CFTNVVHPEFSLRQRQYNIRKAENDKVVAHITRAALFELVFSDAGTSLAPAFRVYLIVLGCKGQWSAIRVVGFVARILRPRSIWVELWTHDEARQPRILCSCGRCLRKTCPNLSLRTRVLCRVNEAVVEFFERRIPIPGLICEIVYPLVGIVKGHHVKVESSREDLIIRIYKDILGRNLVIDQEIG